MLALAALALLGAALAWLFYKTIVAPRSECAICMDWVLAAREARRLRCFRHAHRPRVFLFWGPPPSCASSVPPPAVSPLRHLPGPKPVNALMGNMKAIIDEPPCEPQLRWTKEYGPIVHYTGLFGAQRLLVTHPELVKRVLRTHASNYPKPVRGAARPRPTARNPTNLGTLLCANGERGCRTVSHARTLHVARRQVVCASSVPRLPAQRRPCSPDAPRARATH